MAIEISEDIIWPLKFPSFRSQNEKLERVARAEMRDDDLDLHLGRSSLLARRLVNYLGNLSEASFGVQHSMVP